MKKGKRTRRFAVPLIPDPPRMDREDFEAAVRELKRLADDPPFEVVCVAPGQELPEDCVVLTDGEGIRRMSPTEVGEQLEGMGKEDLRQVLRKVTWACLFAGLSEREVLENVSEKISQYGTVQRGSRKRR